MFFICVNCIWLSAIILLLSLWFVAVKSIVTKNIQSKSRKLCEALADNKSYSENLKMNEEQLIKAYYTASLRHLKDIEVVYF